MTNATPPEQAVVVKLINERDTTMITSTPSHPRASQDDLQFVVVAVIGLLSRGVVTGDSERNDRRGTVRSVTACYSV